MSARSVQNSQQTIREGGEENKEPGGYMAIYHDIEEICYGPESGFPEIMRVFLCIRHKLLRDGLGQKAIGCSFIMEKTGLQKHQVIAAAKKLEKMGYIIISHDKKTTARGKIQYGENLYQLSPVRFGEYYNWYKNNPTVRAYSKDGKTGSYSKRGVLPEEKLSTQAEDKPVTPVSDRVPEVVSDEIPGVVSDQVPPNEYKFSELLEKIKRNNPSLITHINNPTENLNFSETQGTKKAPKRTPEEQERIIREQVELLKAGKI
jgi:hypothetical protein